MSEFWNWFSEIEINLSIIIIMMGISLPIALFDTLLIRSLYELKIRPKWLLFVFNPAAIAIGTLIYKPLGLVIFLFFFISVFALAILGMSYDSIKKYIQYVKVTDKRNKKKTSLWKILLHIIISLLLLVTFFFLGPAVIIFIVLFIFLIKLSKPNPYLQLQAILPTSVIRSMAMGLVEVKGKVKKIELLQAPIKSRACVAYRYVVEDISKDSDGHKSYSTAKDETVCNDFYMVDETGEVEIKAESLELLNIEVSDQYSNGSRRYTQYLIKEGDEMLLIGKASTENQKTIIEREEIKNIFAIAPAKFVSKWNKYKPLLNSFLTATLVIASIVVFILLADISIDENTVHFSLKNIRFDWGELFNK
jgi:hypothetical protein